VFNLHERSGRDSERIKEVDEEVGHTDSPLFR
jgi:hypothetical protein